MTQVCITEVSMKNQNPILELPKISGVTVRFLSENEKAKGHTHQTMPLVIEPLRSPESLTRSGAGGANTAADLRNFLSENAELLTHLQTFGAILFRGFEIRNEKEFESVLSKVPWFKPMPSYFMVEEGRTNLPGHQFVYPTNSVYKTGGGIKKIRGFHTENFSSLDVPRFISFWCQSPCLEGGETALLDMNKAYEALSDKAKSIFETQWIDTKTYATRDIASRYGTVEKEVITLFTDEKVPLIQQNDVQFVQVRKPAVFVNPENGRKSLMIHLTTPEIPGKEFDEEMRKQLAAKYEGWKWTVHRAIWNRPHVMRFLTYLLPMFLNKFKSAKPSTETFFQRKKDDRERRLSKDEVKTLARALAQNTSLFHWKRRDLLLIHNPQVAHAGMPGIGARNLRVMLGSPISLPYPIESGTWRTPSFEAPYRSFDERLRELPQA